MSHPDPPAATTRSSSSREEEEQRCEHNAQLASMQYHASNYRQAASWYLAAFEASAAAAASEGGSKWEEANRWHLLYSYTSLLLSNSTTPNGNGSKQGPMETPVVPVQPEVMAALERIVFDRHEAKVFRAHAAFTFAMLSWLADHREVTAEYYRDAVRISKKTSERERRRKVLQLNLALETHNSCSDDDHESSDSESESSLPPRKRAKHNNNPNSLLVYRSVGEIVDEIQCRAQERLSRLETVRVDSPTMTMILSAPPLLAQQGDEGIQQDANDTTTTAAILLTHHHEDNTNALTPLPLSVVQPPPRLSQQQQQQVQPSLSSSSASKLGVLVSPTMTTGRALTREQASHLLSVGGARCDHCHLSLQELGMKHLHKCSRCRRAYYCSAACQKAQWHAGHKSYCRKPQRFKVGDYVRLVSRRHADNTTTTNNNIVMEVVDKDPKEPKTRIQVAVPGGAHAPISIAKDQMRHLRPLK